MNENNHPTFSDGYVTLLMQLRTPTYIYNDKYNEDIRWVTVSTQRHSTSATNYKNKT